MSGDDRRGVTAVCTELFERRDMWTGVSCDERVCVPGVWADVGCDVWG